MSTPDVEAPSPLESTPLPSGRGSLSPDSGVVRREDDENGAPPWDVVRDYLDHGDHAERVEGYAAASPAFADVLAALRNDQEDPDEPMGVVLPFRR
jgi:hypothetical protein